MTNEKEKLAREWAEQVKSVPEVNYGPKANAAADHILATTTKPTMDEVEWDAKKHVLAGATLLTNNDEQVDVVMLAKDVSIIDYATLDGKHGYEHYSYFTPNGKKYELHEAIGGEHPETLTTVEDYEDAPTGTVMSMPSGLVLMKEWKGTWRAAGLTHPLENEVLADSSDIPAIVLRKGWGK